MDEDKSQVRQSVDTAPREPEEIRRDIEETREELGDTVAALAVKADVKEQAKRRISEAKHSASERKEQLIAKAKGAAPDSAAGGAQGAAIAAKQNPVATALAGGFLAGFLAGRVFRRH